MGGSGVTPEQGEDLNGSSPLFISKLFWNELPMYMSIGMTYEQYWYGDPDLPRYYLKAENLRRKRRNEEAWWQGLYVYHAILDAAPVLIPFSKKHEPLPYPEEPFPQTKEEEKEQERRREKRKMEEFKASMIARVEAWNKSFEKGR